MKFQTSQVGAGPLYFNVTSFVDILMVLVIFMLVAWSTAKIESDVGIQLPTSSSSAPRNPAPTPVIVNVRADGSMAVNQKEITDNGLIRMLVDELGDPLDGTCLHLTFDPRDIDFGLQPVGAGRGQGDLLNIAACPHAP